VNLEHLINALFLFAAWILLVLQNLFDNLTVKFSVMLLPTLVLQVAALVTQALASAQPVVHLPYGSFEGITDKNITQFLGIPFAQPP
jgi:hypothetical protein